jgi:hypothetical protein
LGLGSLLLVIEETNQRSLVLEIKWVDNFLEVFLDFLVQWLHMVESPLLLKLLIGNGKHLRILFGTCTVSQFHPVENGDLGKDTTWLRNYIKKQLTFWDGQEDLDLTPGKDVHLIGNLTLFEDFLILIVDVETEDDGQLVEDVFG